MKKALISLSLVFIINILFSESLKVAAVQLEISDLTYSSYEQFKIEMESNVREAVNTFAPDLIVFPEYASVFPAVTPYFKYIGNSESIEEIFMKIHNENSRINSLKDLFLEEADNVNSLLNFWGELARKYSVTILGGSYFASDGENLTNRLIVFGPTGERIYEQDKYFLTEFETDIINLSSGSPLNPGGFKLMDKQIVLTICRDTFLDRWEDMYDDADLWIDIKANGVEFTKDQRELFTRALPARMKESAVPYGATVCLTGQFLELLWEGESSFVKKIGADVHTFITSRDIRSNEILYFIID